MTIQEVRALILKICIMLERIESEYVLEKKYNEAKETRRIIDSGIEMLHLIARKRKTNPVIMHFISVFLDLSIKWHLIYGMYIRYQLREEK